MVTQSQQEMITLAVVGAFAAFIFWETREFGVVRNGQISPGTFPRIAAGTMVIMAAIRAFLLLTGTARPVHPGGGRWTWAMLKRPAGGAVLMVVFALSFGTVPFAPLTAAFVLGAFVVFGVRPWKRLLIGAAISTAFLYLLFVQLLNVGV